MMKKLVFLLSVLAIVSCKKEEPKKEPLYPKSVYEAEKNAENGAAVSTKAPEELGKEIFEGKGNCFACHQVDQKIIGPSVVEISKIYKEKNGDIVAFLKAESEPIVDPSQFAVMQVNLELTKTFSDEELKSLEVYIHSTLK